jgi:hypothetical protein
MAQGVPILPYHPEREDGELAKLTDYLIGMERRSFSETNKRTFRMHLYVLMKWERLKKDLF